MIAADAFLEPARKRGFDFFAGVPCSFLTPIINRVIGDRSLDYVGAVNEGEAVAIAAGAWLGGRRTVVMCQNSGLGNMVNPLTSLNYSFRIPTLLIVTWRGQPGLQDEPQHDLMGQITGEMLALMRVGHRPFPTEAEDIEPALTAASAAMAESELPFALIMQKDSVRDDGLDQEAPVIQPAGRRIDLRSFGPRPTRIAALERFSALVPESAAVIATTGKSGRELFTLNDREQHLYQVGSMGCASAMGLGVALTVDRPVAVIDGDGAMLMRMGTLATIGARAPKNLVHIVLDNGTHDSTGGQRTDSANVDAAALALAAGYRRGISADDLAGFETALRLGFEEAGPTLIHLRILPGSIEKLGRPTVKPPEVARRFRDFLAMGK